MIFQNHQNRQFTERKIKKYLNSFNKINETSFSQKNPKLIFKKPIYTMYIFTYLLEPYLILLNVFDVYV